MAIWERITWFFQAIANLRGSSIFFAILGGFIPTFFWLWFWLQEDKKKPEPARLIFKTFIIGGFFIVIAFCLERMVSSDPNAISNIQQNIINGKLSLVEIISIFSPIIAWALIEEFVKYISAYVAALKNKNFDEPVDAMIYMITAALGFAAVENFLFLLNTAMTDGTVTSSFLFTGNLRFLGATLLHVVTSATLGAFLGLTFYKNKVWKTISLFLGLITATILHAIFNFFIITNEGQNIFRVLIGLWFAAMVVIFLFEIIKKVVRYPQVSSPSKLTAN